MNNININTNSNITFPSGKIFSRNKLEKNASGFYKIFASGIEFYRSTGELFAMLKKGRGDYPLFISANREESGGIRYSYLSSRTEEFFGFNDIKYSDKCFLEERMWREMISG